MKHLKGLFLMYAFLLVSQDLYAWGFSDLKKDVEKGASTVGSGAKFVGGAVKKGANAVGDAAKDVWDKTTSMHVYYHYNNRYAFGIKDMFLELLFSSEKPLKIYLIKNGNFVKKGHVKDLFRNISTGYNSTLASAIFSNNYTSSSSILKFFLHSSVDELSLSSEEQTTTTNSSNNGGAFGSSSSSRYGSQGSYQSNENTKQIGNSTIKAKNAQSAIGYKVSINGSATSKTPMYRAFYFDVQ
jgi:hypothetical protein